MQLGQQRIGGTVNYITKIEAVSIRDGHQPIDPIARARQAEDPEHNEINNSIFIKIKDKNQIT